MVLLLTAITAWLLQNVLHESSHALCASMAGCKNIKIIPYPHIFNKRFFFARCEWKQPFAKWKPNEIVWLAPVISALIIISIAGTFSITTSNKYIAYTLCFLIAGVIDLSWWISGYFFGTPYCDGKKWKYGDP